mmetsp:Transcript_9362/g.18484  ORF Transcript_9362/g.18484 Transcript_9362/m.18484 type:complete len:86 (+) Transcript_9362:1241-1498(+)
MNHDIHIRIRSSKKQVHYLPQKALLRQDLKLKNPGIKDSNGLIQKWNEHQGPHQSQFTLLLPNTSIPHTPHLKWLVQSIQAVIRP